MALSLKRVSKSYRLFGRKTQFQTLKSALLKRELKPAPSESVEALQDVTFEVGRGEAFGIIGRNGSGKSTLLKIISGILKPTAGNVKVEGRISALIELGTGFHPEISGRENISINGIMMGLTKREIASRFDRIVEFAGIGAFLDEPVKTYSSGMYVRLGFAVAVHVDPDILLIDEVLAVGDEEFTQKCIATIQEMKARGVTMIFVTHQLDYVRSLCDRALWIDGGKVRQLGDPVRVVDAYLQSIAKGRGAAQEELPADTGTSEDESEEQTEKRDPNDLSDEERWGSGEVLLSRVALTDAAGNELIAIGAGSAVTVVIDVHVREPQTDFVFGIGIYHADGYCVYGTNTELEGWKPLRLEADGTVRFVVEKLELVGGSYRIDAAVHTKNGRAFDYRRGVIRFVAGSHIHDIGVYRPGHRWEFSPEIQLKATDVSADNVPTPMAEYIRDSETPPEDPQPPEEKPRYRKRKERRGK